MEIIFCGGCGEVGANSTYINIDGTGILIDAGLHPRNRKDSAFPDYSKLEGKPVDCLIITHAHTDHIGAIPYALKLFPHLKIICTEATADLIDIMIRDTAKIIKSEIKDHYPEEMLGLFKPEILERINFLVNPVPYEKEIEVTGIGAEKEPRVKLFHSGHIPGATSVQIISGGKSIFITGDINFENQFALKKALPPRHHHDVVITESTNCHEGAEFDINRDADEFAAYINEITGKGGSVLAPCFSLGKTQEVLTAAYLLMKKGKIPKMPIYTAGLGKKINKIYDKYCYTVPMVRPGFEISDIPQEEIDYDHLYSGKYFSEPSLVVVSNGMLREKTLSYKLALKWVKHRNFGIAVIGYQEETTPGFELLFSLPDKKFDFGRKKITRKCDVKHFRFSLHTDIRGILGFLADTRPVNVFIHHGDLEASENLALQIFGLLPGTKVNIPLIGKNYLL
jgi:cleavage and polyadenylation specificity factor subunit 3